MKISPKIESTLNKVKTMVGLYPFVLFTAFVAAITTILFSDYQRYKYQDSDFAEYYSFLNSKIAITAGLGISLLFALNMLGERLKKRWLPLLGILLLLPFYFYFFPDTTNGYYSFHFIVLAIIFILNHLLVSFIPFMRSKKDETFWEYNKKLFLNVVLTLIFGGVLTGGIELALLAVDKLFNVNLDEIYYLYTFQFMLIFGSCFIFLLFTENGLSYLEQKEKYPIVLKFFCQFILIPLLILYLVILYFYELKILFSWEIPKGWVSYLVIAYSILGILALLLVYPLQQKTSVSWVKLFSRIFYYSLLPLLVLLFTAIFIRINQYGITENRYFVCVIAGWITGISLYFTLHKKATIKMIPLSLFAVGLLSLILPFFNVFSVSYRSQEKELKKILSQNNLIQDGVINFNKPVSDSVYYDIADKFDYLQERKQNDYLLNLTPEPEKAKMDSLLEKNYFYPKNDLKNFFSNIEYNDQENKQQGFYFYQENSQLDQAIDIQNFDYLLREWRFNDSVKINHEVQIVLNQKRDGTNPIFNLVIINKNKPETFSFVPFIKALQDKYKDGNSNNYIPENDLTVTFDLNGFHCKVIFDHLNGYYETNENRSYNGRGILLLKKLQD